MIASAACISAASLDQVHRDFLSAVPRITAHAGCCFRHLRCRDKRADCTQEMVALCWKWWLRLVERGKNPTAFVSRLATFAARQVSAGRRLCGQEPAKDALSPRAQQRHSFTVNSLPQLSTLTVNPLAEALTDNTVSPIPDQVQFRLDFPAWLTTHTQRNRKIAVEMAKGERTKHLARRFNISPARVSQLRRDLHSDWHQFTGDKEVRSVSVGA